VSESGEKTFEATEHRREEFRKQGRYARAKDIGGIVTTAVVALAFVGSRKSLAGALSGLFTRSLGDLGAVERLGPLGALRGAAAPIAAELLPILAGASVLAALVSAGQVGFRVNTEAIAFKLDRLDPKAGFDRLFAVKKNLGELVMSLLRVATVGTVGYRAVVAELPILLAIARAPLAASTERAAAAVAHVVFAILLALVVLAVADYAYAWFMLEQEMKMSRQERMDESRQQEGDQKSKHRMRARARASMRKRAATSVKGADVIVTNPTHVAVALRYGPRDPAPVVIAKGLDDVALRLRAEARRYGIPILENKPLARALHAEVAVGRPVPQAHFAAVAQVLAFVYRLKKKGALG